jgi:hypothetical protein
MNSSQSLYRYLLFLVSPFITLLSLFQYQEIRKSKWVLILIFGYIGFIALPIGDLEFYQMQYYSSTGNSISELFVKFFQLKSGKFYTEISAIFFSWFFETHHFYFSFLFIVFGYFLFSLLELILLQLPPTRKGLKFAVFVLLLFIFFSLRNTLSLPFYTGVLFTLLIFFKTIYTDQNRFLVLLIFAPIFHLALVIVWIPAGLFLLFKNSRLLCLSAWFVSVIIPNSIVSDQLGVFAQNGKGTLVETKYKTYASEEGINTLNKRYSKGAEDANYKLSLLNNTKTIIFNWFIPLLLLSYSIWRIRVHEDAAYEKLMNLALLFLAFSNLTATVSNGERFQIFYASTVVFCILPYIFFKEKNILFSIFATIVVASGLFLSVMNLYACNEFIPVRFFYSNPFFELIQLI